MGQLFTKSVHIPFQEVISTIPLTNTQLAVFNNRYLPLLQHMKDRSHRLAISFHASRGIVTVGSLLIPALLSIQYDTGSNCDGEQKYNMYWFTWTVSLIVTMCNGLYTLLKLDKRYFLVHTTLEQTISEGWQYIELSGKYSGFYTPGVSPTHDNQFKFFSHSIEKIRMNQVEQEYYKLAESTSGVDSKADSKNDKTIDEKLHSLVPPTPSKEDLMKVPIEIQTVVDTQLSHLIEEKKEDGSGETLPSRE